MDRKFLITFALSVVTPILFITFVRCGRIHSVCEVEVPLLTFIFPYAVLSIIPFPETNALFYGLAAVQFPVYSVLWYFARKKTQLRWPGWALVGCHFVVALLAFIVVASVVH